MNHPFPGHYRDQARNARLRKARQSKQLKQLSEGRPSHAPKSRATRPERGIIPSALRALLLQLPASILLLLCGAAVASSVADPNALMLPLSLGALALTAFFGGIMTAWLCGASGSPLLCGLCSGTLFSLLVLLAASLLRAGVSHVHSFGIPMTLCLHLLLLPIAMLGAAIIIRKR